MTVHSWCARDELRDVVMTANGPVTLRLPRMELPAFDDEESPDYDKMMVQVRAIAALASTHLKTVAGLAPITPSDSLFVAVALGHVVRASKIYDALLDLVDHGRTEVAIILARCLDETNLRLGELASESGCEIADAYVRDSLHKASRTYFTCRDLVASAEAQEFDDAEASRIVTYFEAAAARLETLAPSLSSERPKGVMIEKRFERAGIPFAYLLAYRILSETVHGGWFDIDSYHVSMEGGTAVPSIGPRRPRPWHVAGTSAFTMDTCTRYVETCFGRDAAGLAGRLSQI